MKTAKFREMGLLQSWMGAELVFLSTVIPGTGCWAYLSVYSLFFMLPL